MDTTSQPSLLEIMTTSTILSKGDFSLDGLIFLKLGGSLITDKRTPECARYEVIQQVAGEIAEAYRREPELKLVIGHGSGSFGHLYGQQYGTRAGVKNFEEWLGFARTSDAAGRLNRIVTQALLETNLPVWSIQPSVALECADGQIVAGPEQIVTFALARGLLPLIHGDVALDSVRGGTIVSTEEIFDWLATSLRPRRLILIGEVDGIYTADPQLDSDARRIPLITPATAATIADKLGESYGMDVTGGMVAKVQHVMTMVQQHETLQNVLICSGLVKGQLLEALLDAEANIGTRIRPVCSESNYF